AEQLPPSLVVMVSEQRQFSAGWLEQKLGCEFLQRVEQRDGGESFMLQKDETLLVVHNCPQRYFGRERGLPPTKDRRMRQIVEQHNAWFSVDLHDSKQAFDERSALGYLGPLVAALGDEDSVALFDPRRTQLHCWTQETAALLRTNNPLDWMAQTNAE